MTPRIHLRSLLLVAMSAAFVALLIGFTRDLAHLWPLAGLPIVLAALLYGPKGALVVGALTGAAAALATVGESPPLPAAAAPGLAAGLATFVIAGLLAGFSVRREQGRVTRAEHDSVVDPLTGLLNREHFMARLDEEVCRARRYGSDLGLALFDVDDLRTFNDTFGRYKGDVLLRHLGEILKLSTRDSDVLARYEGGSFAVALPCAGEAEAPLVAERLRMTIEGTDFEGDELEPATKRTVSAGVAAFPTVAGGANELLEHASRALRRAKAEGGNRVAASEAAAATRSKAASGAEPTPEPEPATAPAPTDASAAG